MLIFNTWLVIYIVYTRGSQTAVSEDTFNQPLQRTINNLNSKDILYVIKKFVITRDRFAMLTSDQKSIDNVYSVTYRYLRLQRIYNKIH